MPEDPEQVFLVPSKFYNFMLTEVKNLNPYMSPLEYFEEKYTINKVLLKEPSIFNQIKLTPYNTYQKITRFNEQEFIKNAHPQYLSAIINKFRIVLEENKEIVNEIWLEIANRYDKYLEIYSEILEFFRDEVDKKIYNDYLNHVDHEMFVLKMCNRLRNGFYQNKRAIVRDLENIQHNASKYNLEDSPIVGFSKFLLKLFTRLIEGELNDEEVKEYQTEFDVLRSGRIDSAKNRTSLLDNQNNNTSFTISKSIPPILESKISNQVKEQSLTHQSNELIPNPINEIDPIQKETKFVLRKEKAGMVVNPTSLNNQTSLLNKRESKEESMEDSLLMSGPMTRRRLKRVRQKEIETTKKDDQFLEEELNESFNLKEQLRERRRRKGGDLKKKMFHKSYDLNIPKKGRERRARKFMISPSDSGLEMDPHNQKDGKNYDFNPKDEILKDLLYNQLNLK